MKNKKLLFCITTPRFPVLPSRLLLYTTILVSFQLVRKGYLILLFIILPYRSFVLVYIHTRKIYKTNSVRLVISHFV